LEELRAFDIIQEGRVLGVEESMKKVEIVSELERSTLMEEVSWRQKSRVTSAQSFLHNGQLQQKKELHRLLVY